MNKIKSFLLASLMVTVLFSINVLGALREPTESFYVNDYASVLTNATKLYIEEINENLASSGAEIVVVTVDFLDGMDVYDYGFELFNDWGVGDSEADNGLLLILAIAEEDYAIVLGEGTEINIIDSGSSWSLLQLHLEDDFDAGDYDSGVYKTVSALGDKVADYYGIEDLGSNEPGIVSNSDADASGLLTDELTAYNAKYVNDDAGVLKSNTIKSITSKNEKLWEMNGGQIVINTVASTGSQNIADYTIDLFNTLGIGDADRNNGVLVLMAIDDKDYFVALGDGLAEQVRETEFNNLLNKNFVKEFDKGNYDKAASKVVDDLYDLIVDIYGDDTAGYYAGAVTAPSAYKGGSQNRSAAGAVGDFIGNIVSLIILLCIIFVIVSVFARPRRGVVVVPRRRFFWWPAPRRRHYWGSSWGHRPPPPPGPGPGPSNSGPAQAPPRSKPSGGSLFGGGSSSVGTGSSGRKTSSGSGFGSSGASRGGGASRSNSGFGGSSRSGGSSFGGSSRSSGGASRGGGGMSRGGGASRGGKR